MKQFNLEEYLKNPSRKVVTRDGRNVTIHCTNYRGNFPIVAEIEGLNYSTGFTKGGVHMYWNCIKETDYDLFFAPEKHEGWINIYRNPYTGETSFGVIPYNSRKEAEDVGKSDDYYVATGKFEWEE